MEDRKIMMSDQEWDVFYINEGSTQDRHGDEVENCQILGWASEESFYLEK